MRANKKEKKKDRDREDREREIKYFEGFKKASKA